MTIPLKYLQRIKALTNDDFLAWWYATPKSSSTRIPKYTTVQFHAVPTFTPTAHDGCECYKKHIVACAKSVLLNNQSEHYINGRKLTTAKGAVALLRRLPRPSDKIEIVFADRGKGAVRTESGGNPFYFSLKSEFWVRKRK